MADSDITPTYFRDQTSPTFWDVLLEGSALVAGTITQDGDEYLLADAQNLSRGSYPTVMEACTALADGDA
jgi:hypothetical protein